VGIQFAAVTDDRQRLNEALKNPKRRAAPDPLDPRLESPLGRARIAGDISEYEFNAGVKWRNAHSLYMRSIMKPEDLTEERCETALKDYQRGIKILLNCGNPPPGKRSVRVLHAVNAIAVFDEPEELGDFEFTLKAARVGLSALSLAF
jgi:hypothetical protein